MGSSIGSGIFKKPALMAGRLGSPVLLIAVWIIAGVLTLFGSLSNAEIAGMFPETGGQYVYFRKIYGDFVSYMYGWAAFAVIQSASVASIAYVFAESLTHFVDLPRFSVVVEQAWQLHLPFIGTIFPLADFGVKSVAIVLILLLTILNYWGVKVGGAVQDIMTGLKVLGILGIVLMAVSSGVLGGSSGSLGHFGETLPNAPHSPSTLFSAMIAALAGAFWAYDGWNNLSFVGGEIKNPEANIPKGLFIGTLSVIALYVAINLAYVYVLPLSALSSAKIVASDAARTVMGPWGEKFVLLSILLSTFGACNGSTLTSARIYFAMARENRFFKFVGEVQPRYQTPGNSLFLQFVWASLLVLSGTFDILTDMLVFVAWLFYALGAYGVFVLRKKMPDRPRPYKVWGYPWVPASFVILASVYVVVTLRNDIVDYLDGKVVLINSVFGLALVASGIPFYFYFKMKEPFTEQP